MKKTSKLLFVFCIIFSACGIANNEVVPTDNSENEELLRLVNDWRKKGCDCGGTYMQPAADLKWNNTLEKAALLHSEDMQKNNYFSHTGKNGSSPGDRITAAGYNWSTYGENIAKGYNNAADVILGWRNSPGHCKNMMNPNFKEMGIGKSGDYWTQVLGAGK